MDGILILHTLSLLGYDVTLQGHADGVRLRVNGHGLQLDTVAATLADTAPELAKIALTHRRHTHDLEFIPKAA